MGFIDAGFKGRFTLMLPVTTSNATSCTLMVTMEENLDWDDFMGMVQQVQAINLGLADPVKAEVVEQSQQYAYTWTEGSNGHNYSCTAGGQEGPSESGIRKCRASKG